MGQQISAIITSIKYTGIHPGRALIGNYVILPVDPRIDRQFIEKVVAPCSSFTQEARNLIKDLSFQGSCAYLEIDFHGGQGTQIGEVWKDGTRQNGPYLSNHGPIEMDSDTMGERFPGVQISSEAANQCLRHIGIYKRDGMDEFDSAGLGSFSNNKEILLGET